MPALAVLARGLSVCQLAMPCASHACTHAHVHAVTPTRQPVQVLAVTSPQGFSVAAAAWRFAAAASQVTLTPPAQFVACPPGLALPPQLLAHSRAELAIRVIRFAAAAALCASWQIDVACRCHGRGAGCKSLESPCESTSQRPMPRASLPGITCLPGRHLWPSAAHSVACIDAP